MPSNICRKVAYIFGEDLLKESDKHPVVQNRASIVHELIAAYNLLKNFKIISPKKCDYNDLRVFHSESYLDALNKTTEDEDSSLIQEEFGLGYDCPTWLGIYDYVSIVAGGSIQAAYELNSGESDLVINWTGGWHHSKADIASGHCYVNDIVLCILKLRQKFDRILYIDLDAHHGDSVEDAFSSTKRVFTVSFHQYETGFYPGSGSVEDCGFGSAKGYAVNFPYKSGITGDDFKEYFERVIGLIFERYSPQALVVQCGGDVIVGDPLTETNLTPEDLGVCIKHLLNKNIPMILLGGGGYNLTNTSRFWTYLTSVVCDTKLEDDIPDNKFFLSYGPDYVLSIVRNPCKKNYNTKEYLSTIFERIMNNLTTYKVTNA